MKKSLKILSLIISILIIMQSVPALAQSGQTLPNTYVTSEDSAAIETLLTKLGIVTDTGAADDSVIKAKYIEYLVNMMQIPLVPAAEQLFFDVPLTSAYADVVNTAYTAGLTKGNTDGTLAVDTPITLNEAVVMAVRTLGAEIMLSEGDRSYASYISVAQRLGILDGVTTAEGGVLNRENALRIIFNTLNSDCIATKDGKEYYIDDITLLENYYKIYTSEGVIESCRYGDIYGGETKDADIVTIEGENYSCDGAAAKELLGHRVTFYYKESDRGATDEIVYMYSDGTKITQIDVEDVEYHKQGTLEYIDGNDKTDDVKLSDTALTLVNGKRTGVSSSGMVLPEHGVVTLIDNDNNGRYDIVHYNEYTIAMASSVNAAEEMVYCQKGKYGAIELSDYEAYYIYDTAGNALEIDSITKNAVLNISENGYKTVMEIVVCKDTADFDIVSMRTETKGEITIYYFEDSEGNEYSTVSDFADISDKNSLITQSTGMAMSNKYVFALNTDGKIAAILERIESNGYMYGYIIATDKGNGLSSDIKARMLTEEKGVVDYSLADKVRVVTSTGSQSKNKAEVTLDTGVVRYKLDSDGKVNSLEFPQTTDSDIGLRKDKTITTGQSESTRFYSSNGMLGGQIVVNENTKVFFMPTKEHEGDEEWFYAGKGTSLVNQSYYPSAVSYKYDDDIYADVIVANTGYDVLKGSALMLVENVVKIYDKNTGESYDAIKGYVNGNLMSYGFDNDSAYPVPEKALTFRAAPGDVVRFTVNSKGNIGLMEPVLDFSEGKVYNFDMGSTVRYPFNNGVCQVYGQMNEIYDGIYMNMKCDDTEYNNYYYPITSGTRFYQYDADEKSHVIKTITANDIPTIKSNTCINEHVLIVTKDTTTTLVVVYK